MTDAAQFTTLLQNTTLARLERMRLLPRRRLTNRSRGEHLAGKGGASIEFNDYRDYSPGDDVRYVDWNIFSRINRPYVKLYRHEEEMHVVVLVDGSTSMQFGGKFEKAKQIAAALGVMGVMNMEPVSVYHCQTAAQAPMTLPRSSGRNSLKRLFSFVEALPVGGDAAIEQAVDLVLRQHSGKGIAIVLSDFLTFGDLEKPLNRLFSAGLETWAVQVLSPEELQPDLSGDVRFVDSETGYTLDVTSAGDLLGVYQEHLAALQESLAALCRQRSGRALTVSSADALESVVFDTFRRKGWVQ